MDLAKKQNILMYYLLVLSMIGMTFVFLATFRYGAGLSTDGAKYLSTAQNLLNGKGFYDFLNSPLTQFPPLFSLIIAGVGFITGADVFVVGQYLNILTFGLVIWLAGRFFYKIFPDELLYAYVGSTIFATSISLIQIAANILSDLLFMAFTIAFLMAATSFLESGSRKNMFILGLIAGLSALERYAGLALIFTGTILTFVVFRKETLKAFFLAGIFGILSSLPIMLWVLFHNYLRTGILFGERLPPFFLGNLQITIEKAVHWFLPLNITQLIPIWALAGISLIILITGNRDSDWQRWRTLLISPQFLPSLIFLGIYLCVLVLNVSYYEVKYLYMDRIHIIIFPSLLALGFMTIKVLSPIYLRRLPSKSLHLIATLVFVLWLSYPLYNIQKYLRSAYYYGDTSDYNMYNTPVLRESGIRDYIKLLPIDSDQKIYSNYEAAAWWLTREPILRLPHGLADSKRVDSEEILKNFPSWPGSDGKGYLIWIKALSYKPYVLSPEQLTMRANFQLVFSSKAADIYILTPK